MIFPTPTTADLLAEVGGVSTSVFTSAEPFFIMFIGVPIAFLLLYGLINFMREQTEEQKRVDKLYNKTMWDSLQL